MALNFKFFKKDIVFFIFRYNFRKLAFNNFLQRKQFKDYILINLSGPYLSWLGLILYKLNISNKFKFISCDGWPYLKKEENSKNIWFGGTILKIPIDYVKDNNNFVTASNIFTKTDKLIKLYPTKIKDVEYISDPKIVIAMKILNVDDDLSLKIWSENKKRILNELSILDNSSFWIFKELEELDNFKKHKIYMDLKSLVRVELLKGVLQNFQDKCILIGNDLKKFYPKALDSNFDKNFLKKFYEGNICLDFLAKDGEQSLYPRSIEIIESGGILAQINTRESSEIFEEYKNQITFNSFHEMIEIINKLIKNSNLIDINKFFLKKYNDDKFVKTTLSKLFE